MHRTIPFVKATACGNDFLIIDGSHLPADISAFTRTICDRHLGVGADGVEWLFPDNHNLPADIHARLFNADGSEAEISGNGTRCVAAYLASIHDKQTFAVRTGAGVKDCKLIRKQGSQFEFEMNMGPARIGDNLELQLSTSRVEGISVSTGNPHFVVFVEEFRPGWQAQAAEAGAHPRFEQGANVELVRVTGPNAIEIRIFERGAGETQSSGTGTCASAAAAISIGKVTSPVVVTAPGGPQSVRSENNNLYLTGPAQLICRGEFFPA